MKSIKVVREAITAQRVFEHFCAEFFNCEIFVVISLYLSI